MTALLAGWFSFEDGHATAGDLLAADLVGHWLQEAGIAYDQAAAPPFPGDVHWRNADPEQYEIVIFVCGPFELSGHEADFFERFGENLMVGLDLSMPESPRMWNPFDVLLERDSPNTGRPDLVFGSEFDRVPVVGVCLVEDYPGGKTRAAAAAIGQLLERVETVRVSIDTRLDVNASGLRTKAEVESLVSAMDVVLTTRLHGLVMALKNGVPAVAIDPVPGGAKIVRQGETIGWPVCFKVDAVTQIELDEAFSYCLSSEARKLAAECGKAARGDVEKIGADFLAALRAADLTESRDELHIRSRERLSALITQSEEQGKRDKWLATLRNRLRKSTSLK